MIITEDKYSITPSLLIEYLYCPRFIYFMEVLKIKQNEEMRFKVQKGRKIHSSKKLTNADYKRKKIGVTEKFVEQELSSKKYGIHGKVDEILFLEDGTASPLDYKFAEYKGRIFKTYKFQSIMYGLLIQDNYDKIVNKGYIVYIRSKNKIIDIEFKESDINKMKKMIYNMRNILENNYFPRSTSTKKRCLDCCYRNICIK